MPQVRVLPHPLCPAGISFAAAPGARLLDSLLAHGVVLEHACEKSCACATCHVHIRRGGRALPPAREDEEDELDHAWGIDADSRLACQVRLAQTDIVVELPMHSRHHAREL